MIVARLRNLRFTPAGRRVPALDGVSLDVRAGEILLVEGPSGSGKSTLLRAMAGLVPHFHGGRFEGSVEVLGADTRTASPAVIARSVGLVFQDPEAQAVRQTVAADVAFGPENLGVPGPEIPERVEWALDCVGASHLAGREVTTLSGGERQRVALAGVLAGDPAIVLLDEPTSQLDGRAVAALDVLLRALSARGTAVVVAEHHAHRLGIWADRTIRLREGRIDLSPPGQIAPPSRVAGRGGTLLAVRDLVAGFPGRPVLRGCTFDLARGTVTALTGDNGSGKSTLLRAIVGLHPVERGDIFLDGIGIADRPVEERTDAIGFLPQDAGRSLIRERVVDELADCARRAGDLEVARRTRSVVRDLDLHDHLDRHPLDLSVGERERVALGALFMSEPGVVLLDEPTRGMDEVHRRDLVQMLRRRSAEGAAVLVATHDPQFAEAVADEHVAIVDGVIVEPRVAVGR